MAVVPENDKIGWIFLLVGVVSGLQEYPFFSLVLAVECPACCQSCNFRQPNSAEKELLRVKLEFKPFYVGCQRFLEVTDVVCGLDNHNLERIVPEILACDLYIVYGACW